jgi:beta-galactosidase
MSSSVTLDKKGVRIGGRYKTLLCASLFYFRLPQELWRDRIKRLKAAGYNCADVYFPWNYHELAPGKWDFSGCRDAARFLDMLAEEGVYVVARPGPYICSEWDGGAIPAWILASGMRIRENGRPFMAEVRKWYARIMPVIAARELGRGGSVILVQLDNELDFFDCPNPKAYMGALARMARSLGVSAPLFGCAGQCDARGSTGFARGVYNTYNFYPAGADPHFDGKCGALAQALARRGQPLLITETNREHGLLRRELAGGAKLLGAYNQVGGFNFGFTNSINNWGQDNPLSFIASDYDFRSMIGAAGEFGPEALEGRLLRGLIDALGESLSCAEPASGEGFAADCSFPTREGGPSVLALQGGGALLCVPNLSGEAGIARVRGQGFEFEAEVGAYRSPLYPVGVPTDKTGVKGFIKYSTAEILAMEKGLLLLYSDVGAEAIIEPEGATPVHIAPPGGRIEDGRGGVLDVRILGREEAARRGVAGRWDVRIADEPAFSMRIPGGLLAEYEPPWADAPASADGGMESHGLYRGYALYEASAEAGQPVLLRGAADIVTAYDAGKRLDTRVSGGQWQLYAGGGAARRFKAECWGHSNFDDPRLDSLRLSSAKGISAAYGVLSEEKLDGRWRFRQMDAWLPKKLGYAEGPLDAMLDPNAWNTTRKPVLALYYADVFPQPGCTDLAVRLGGGSAEAAVYANGKPVCVLNPFDPWALITAGRSKGGKLRLELLCRKRDWNERAGDATLYHLRRLPLRVSGFGEEQLAKIDAQAGKETPLPARFGADRAYAMRIGMDGYRKSCAYVKVDARDLKLTAVFNGRIVGRIFGQWDGRPFISGGDSAKLYLPGPWFTESGNRLVCFIEPTGDEPELRSLTLEYPDLDGGI